MLLKKWSVAVTQKSTFLMGHLRAEDHTPFYMTPDMLRVHMAVLGGSGSGKSKFLELLARYLILLGHGGLYLDPHGDTAVLLLAFLAHHKKKYGGDLWKKVHYLEVGSESAFAFDPFAKAPLRTEVNPKRYDAWMRTKVNRLARNILRLVSDAEVQVMNRLKRWLKNVLYACGTAFDERGTHWGLDKALVFTDPQRPEFPGMLDRVMPFLPPDVQADFAKLRETKRPRDQEAWVESTINRLRDFLSPLVEEVFAQRMPSIDLKRVIDNREFVIVNLRESDEWDHDEKVTLGGLLIDEVLSAKQAEESVPEDQRIPFTLIIDESGEFIADDLKRALGAVRKYKLSIVLAAQDLSSFTSGDLDISAKVLSQCLTKVCFRQTLRQDKEILADNLATGNIDYTPEYQEVQRQRGFLLTHLISQAVSAQLSEGTASGTSTSSSTAQSLTTSRSATDQVSETESLSRGQSDQVSWSRGQGEQISWKVDKADPRMLDLSVGRSQSWSDGGGTTESSQSGHSSTHGTARSEGEARGLSETLGWMESETRNASNSLGKSFTVGENLVANLVSEWEKTGRLEKGPVQEQYDRVMQAMHLQGTAEALVTVPGVPYCFPITVVPVTLDWAPDVKWHAVEAMRKKIVGHHPYNFRPADYELDGGPGRQIAVREHPRDEDSGFGA